MPGRGTLQGGGTAGGLGLDHEFMESVLVPQVMLTGFMGLRPMPTGFSLAPRLPTDWPSLTITGMEVHGHVVDVQASRDGRVVVTSIRSGSAPLIVEHAGRQHLLGTECGPLELWGGHVGTSRADSRSDPVAGSGPTGDNPPR